MGPFLVILSVVLFLLGGCNLLGALTDRSQNAAVGSGVFAVVFLAAGAVALVSGIKRWGRKSGSAPTRACPFCAEQIQPTAKLCRFCGRDVPAVEAQDWA